MEQVIGLVVAAVVVIGAVMWLLLQSLDKEPAVGLAEYVGIIYRGGAFDGVYDADSQYCFVFDVDGGRFALLEDSIVSSLVELTDDDGRAVFYSLTDETEGEYVVARPYVPEPGVEMVTHPIATWEGGYLGSTTTWTEREGTEVWYDPNGKRVA